eukprot:CAMPEP_0114607608 /NCGR_PEP_ID=MMETSP0168-20121206/2154_1 /TAXON_ID=95228 ORGANISM="Vannella sp., Strain DIVA3 517/6/12" /NCGR_SAMPLE_ID=MMETSP0168 /ASSEMBLY_ACC=CAM_ASM_000044 /LENGTH=274 /DNA_ID=CAMNT_0001818487 /DNA_START=104 /DNA_END=925 /DNA_ORIENTATION=+
MTTVYKAATRQVLIDLDRCVADVVRPEPPEKAGGWFWEPSMWTSTLQRRDFERYLPLIGEIHPGDFKVTGEKSPDYYFMTGRQIERMHRLLPRTKVFITIREPGERLFSHYAMKLRQGKFKGLPPHEQVDVASEFETFLYQSFNTSSWAEPFHYATSAEEFLDSVATAVELKMAQLPTDAAGLRDYSFFFGHDYERHIQAWATHYPLIQQLLVIPFEHIVDHEQFPHGIERLINFLEVTPVVNVTQCFEERGDEKHRKKQPMTALARRFLTALY